MRNRSIQNLCLFALGLLMGCYQRDESILRVGSNVWPGYEALYLARQLGHYDKTAIKLIEFHSASEVLNAFYEREIEVAALTLDEALSLKTNGIDIRIILTMDFSIGAHAIVGRGIEKLEDLRGKRVAVEYNAVGGLLLQSAFESAKITAQEVNIVHAAAGNHLSLFNSVDAVACFEPTASKLIARGGTKLYDSKKIPGMIVDVLVVRTDTMLAYEPELTALIDGYFLATEALGRDTTKTYKIINARLKLNHSQLESVFATLHLPGAKENRELLQRESPKLRQNALTLQDYMLHGQLLKSRTSLDNLFTAAFVPLAPK